MTRYRKRPVEVDAFQWTGGPDQQDDPAWICDAICDGRIYFESFGSESVVLKTLEGDLSAHTGDWIVKGVAGEIYPVKDEIFRATYDEVPPTGGDLLVEPFGPTELSETH